MLYTILAYHEAGVIEALSEAQRAAIMDGLMKVHGKHAAKIGPTARLGFTDGAVTLRGPEEGTVIDGQFAETKEHLLGLYMVECASMDEAIAIARDLRRVNRTAVYEIRPVTLYLPGVAVTDTAT
jgi:hypothetical protein